jgi:hypothetical protein
MLISQRLQQNACALTLLAIIASGGCAPPEDGVDETARAVTGGTLVQNNVGPFDSVVKLGVGCSGTKIGARTFLSAGHCFNSTSAGQTIQITNRLDGAFVAGTTFTISSIVRHPSYNAIVFEGGGTISPRPRVYEATIITINADTPTIPVLPIRAPFVGDGTSALLVGYGCDPVHPANAGQKQFGTVTSQFNNDPDIYAHFWTTRSDSTVMVCNGDSGGPDLIQNPNNGFRWEVSGINVGIGPGAQSGLSRTGSVFRWIAAPAQNVFADGENGNFMNAKSLYCMGIDGASSANGAQSSQFLCDSRNQPNDNQSWQLRSTGSGRFNFVNRNSGLCLGVSGASLSDGALLQQFNCAAPDPNNNQAWRFVRSTTNFYQVVNGKSNKCITVNSADGSGNGTHLVQSTCGALGSMDRQGWTFTR